MERPLCISSTTYSDGLSVDYNFAIAATGEYWLFEYAWWQLYSFSFSLDILVYDIPHYRLQSHPQYSLHTYLQYRLQTYP